MDSDDVEVYIIQGEEGEEWASPTPAGRAVAEAVADETDLNVDDVDDLDAYVSLADLRAVFDEGGELTFTVEGYEVTVDSTGDIDVSD